MPHPSVLVIEGSDFETFPAGGQLAMGQALMKLFGNRLGLVGMSMGAEPIGQWIQKEISGATYTFLSVARKRPSAKRPLIPARLTFYKALRRFRSEILSLGCRAAFIQAPEALLAVSQWNWDSLCYWFAGIENPLKTSRYQLAKPFWRLFDHSWFSALDRASVVLAAADETAISSVVSRSNGRLSGERLIPLPTCVDTSFFYPAPAVRARAELDIASDCQVFVAVGRISKRKGWELMLDAFERYLRINPPALLFFVGDGEDRSRLMARADARGLTSRVSITGFQNPTNVRRYLNAADAVLCGSFQEGWSVAMLEALACGKPIVSTEVSGVRTMIKPEQNGYILASRDPAEFAEAMKSVLTLSGASHVSRSIAVGFDLTKMGQTLARLWPPLQTEVWQKANPA